MQEQFEVKQSLPEKVHKYLTATPSEHLISIVFICGDAAIETHH